MLQKSNINKQAQGKYSIRDYRKKERNKGHIHHYNYIMLYLVYSYYTLTQY